MITEIINKTSKPNSPVAHHMFDLFMHVDKTDGEEAECAREKLEGKLPKKL